MAPYKSEVFIRNSAEVRTVTPVVSHCRTQFSSVVLPRWMTAGTTAESGEASRGSPHREMAPSCPRLI